MVKKTDVGPSWEFAKDLDSRVRQAATLSELLAVLEEAKGHDVPSKFLPLYLNSLANKAAAEGGTAAAVEAGDRLLEVALALHGGGGPPESMVTNMVRLCCASGAQRRALALVAEAQTAGTKPKLRTLSAILAQAVQANDAETRDHVWTRLRVLGLDPQDTEYAAMLRSLRGSLDRQYGLLRQLLEDLPSPSDPPLIEEIGRAFGVEGVADFQAAEVPHAEGRVEDGSWRVGWTRVDAEGLCALSGHRLQALRISQADEEELFQFAACLPHGKDPKGRNPNFVRFRKWLEDRAPYDVIVDGANVGYNNQNREGGHFQYRQIDAVVRELRSQGKRVLLVLHPKWLREDPDLSVVKRKRRKFNQISVEDVPSLTAAEDAEVHEAEYDYPHEPLTQAEREAPPATPMAIVRSWKECGVLLRIPEQDCDDWYWLFAALDSARRGVADVQVVSNDQMRDHHWRMLGRRAFGRWRERHMTNVSIWLDTPTSADLQVTLTPPRPFSIQAQVSQDGSAWHFPVLAIQSRADELLTGRPVSNKAIEAAECKWLVAWRDQASAPAPPPSESQPPSSSQPPAG